MKPTQAQADVIVADAPPVDDEGNEGAVGGVAPAPSAAPLAAVVLSPLAKHKVWLWQQYAGRITPGVQRVVEFAKRVPGFCDFSQDDQLILIKLGFFEVWISHATRLAGNLKKAATLNGALSASNRGIGPSDAVLTFDDGSFFSREQMESLYDVSIYGTRASLCIYIQIDHIITMLTFFSFYL